MYFVEYYNGNTFRKVKSNYTGKPLRFAGIKEAREIMKQMYSSGYNSRIVKEETKTVVEGMSIL